MVAIPSANSGEALTERAYACRNDFVHESRLVAAESAEELRKDLSELVWSALRRAALLPIDPAVDYGPH